MKKNMIALVVAGAALAGINVANAYEGQVHFTGTIIDTACSVNGGSTSPIQVVLGTVAKSTFAANGDKSDPTKFKISLTNCPTSLTQAAIKFDGTSDAVDNTVLALDSGSTAKGVGVEIGQMDGTKLPLFTASTPVPITSGAADLNFVGRYVATNYTALASGTANATSNFTVSYN